MSIPSRYYKAVILACAAGLLVLLASTAQAQFWKKQSNALLPDTDAFVHSAEIVDNRVLISWIIADGYYMYREQFSVESASPQIQVGTVEYPVGVVEDDPEFGPVEVYFVNANLSAPLTGTAGPLELVLKGQGCNKPVGVCYPPLERRVTLDYQPVANGAAPDRSANNPASPARDASDKTFFTYVLSAFLAGILLSFTPCVLPMIPILAGVIAGQKNPARWQSGWLAICYVLGTIATYMIAGAVAGATGAQLQAYFQNIWVISAICLLLVILAASLFGWFRIELPSALQNRLSAATVSTRSAAISSFSLGLVSALVVGACVSPILILALGAAITQGDPVLGAAIMGAMATGMGLLLILFGFGAGWILPRTGAWMNQIQVIFGFMVLGVAIYLLSNFSFVPNLLLWAALLLTAGFYVWQHSEDIDSALAKSAIRAIAAAAILWGGMALVGGSLKGDDILRPLDNLSSISGASANTKSTVLPFKSTTKLAEAKQLVAEANSAGRPILLDFYADWCLDCKRMHRTTFKDAQVADALSGWQLIEIDVTETSPESEKLKRHFQVFGPPATLFYDRDGTDRLDLRQYGYIDTDDFLALVKQIN